MFQVLPCSCFNNYLQQSSKYILYLFTSGNEKEKRKMNCLFVIIRILKIIGSKISILFNKPYQFVFTCLSISTTVPQCHGFVLKKQEPPSHLSNHISDTLWVFLLSKNDTDRHVKVGKEKPTSSQSYTSTTGQ